MVVYILLGGYEYEGFTVLDVFAEKSDAETDLAQRLTKTRHYDSYKIKEQTVK